VSVPATNLVNKEKDSKKIEKKKEKWKTEEGSFTMTKKSMNSQSLLGKNLLRFFNLICSPKSKLSFTKPNNYLS
jgi:hypothetical protein